MVGEWVASWGAQKVEQKAWNLVATRARQKADLTADYLVEQKADSMALNWADLTADN